MVKEEESGMEEVCICGARSSRAWPDTQVSQSLLGGIFSSIGGDNQGDGEMSDIGQGLNCFLIKQ